MESAREGSLESGKERPFTPSLDAPCMPVHASLASTKELRVERRMDPCLSPAVQAGTMRLQQFLTHPRWRPLP